MIETAEATALPQTLAEGALHSRVSRRLLDLALARNRAILAAVVAGLFLAFASLIGAAVVVAGSRGLAVILIGLGLVLIARSVQLHRAMIPDTGAPRRTAADLVAALIAGGRALPLAEAESRHGTAVLLAALDLLARLELVYAVEDDGRPELRLDPSFTLPSSAA